MMSKDHTSMLAKDTSQAVEKDRELNLAELGAVSGGAYDAFIRTQGLIHALNPQPLPRPADIITVRVAARESSVMIPAPPLG
jgi:hypothetical protein